MENNIQEKYAVGLMSGTSLDGIDAALAKISECGLNTKLELVDFISVPISDDLRKRILEASHPSTSNVALITSLNFELGKAFSDAVSVLLEKSKFKGNLDFIASHGQTIYHMPIASGDFVRSTLQIGDPSYLAFDHHTQVVFNFRVMDMVAGGEGAPLVPYSEYVLYRNEQRNVLLQNIGGIGNVTVLNRGCSLDDVWAFDTGPGNMMMNAAVSYFYRESYDRNGEFAKQGQIINQLFEELIASPYLKQTPPKSTGRELFGEDVVQEYCKRYGARPNDVIRTLTYFTAYTISQSYRDFIFVPNEDYEIIIGGGGAYNPVLMNDIRNFLPGYNVKTQEDIGFSSDAKEAIAFIILGNETLYGNTSNAPKATGAKQSVILGQICPNPHK